PQISSPTGSSDPEGPGRDTGVIRAEIEGHQVVAFAPGLEPYMAFVWWCTTTDLRNCVGTLEG
ncbi:MAG: hypothetical protein M3536_08410, partial [Actinomycetota bacterium]|nr:hypothetical protein [Actinomycetota bacterium]